MEFFLLVWRKGFSFKFLALVKKVVSISLSNITSRLVRKDAHYNVYSLMIQSVFSPSISEFPSSEDQMAILQLGDFKASLIT